MLSSSKDFVLCGQDSSGGSALQRLNDQPQRSNPDRRKVGLILAPPVRHTGEGRYPDYTDN